ncbi:ankyrin repeat-containing domain protein, partial [Hyaloscypha finlandica]
TPLSWAAQSGHEGIVKLLLEKGADVEAKDSVSRTPLLYAAKNGNKTTAQLLLATNRIDVDSKDFYNSTPLSILIAARMGHRDVVAFLLTKNPVLNSKDNFGRTPIWWAKRTGSSEIADLLLQKCKENGIIIQKDDFPITTISVPSDKICKNCDVCLLGVSDEDTYYHCRFCNSGDFNICEDCFARKARCLDQCHVLVKEINRE